MSRLEDKLEELGYTKYLNKYYKWINNWRIAFELDYYENDCDEYIGEIVDYHISPDRNKCIDRTEVNEVLDILEKDLKDLKGIENGKTV